MNVEDGAARTNEARRPRWCGLARSVYGRTRLGLPSNARGCELAVGSGATFLVAEFFAEAAEARRHCELWPLLEDRRQAVLQGECLTLACHPRTPVRPLALPLASEESSSLLALPCHWASACASSRRAAEWHAEVRRCCRPRPRDSHRCPRRVFVLSAIRSCRAGSVSCPPRSRRRGA